MYPSPIHLLRGSKEIDPRPGLGFGVPAVTLGLSVPGSALTSYLDARGSEVGDLELDTDGRFALLVFGLYTGETKVGPHEVLLATLGRQRKGLLGSCPAVRPTTNVLSPRLVHGSQELKLGRLCRGSTSSHGETGQTGHGGKGSLGEH